MSGTCLYVPRYNTEVKCQKEILILCMYLLLSLENRLIIMVTASIIEFEIVTLTKHSKDNNKIKFWWKHFNYNKIIIYFNHKLKDRKCFSRTLNVFP